MTTITDMDTDIFQMLVLSADQFRSVHSLYNEYTSNKPTTLVDTRKFVLTCELLDTGFKNVKKIYRNNVCYLAFVTDNSHLPKEIERIQVNVTQEDKDFESIDKCEVIEYMLNNPKFTSSISFTEYVDGTDTVLHVLARKGKYDLLNRIIAVYDVDFDIVNKNNENILDVVDYTDARSSRQIVRSILNYQLNKCKLDNKIVIQQIKKHNTELTEANRVLTKNVNTLELNNSYCRRLLFCMFVLYVATIYIQL